MQQTGLRLLERVAVGVPTAVWPAVALTARPLIAAGRRAEALASNGNRRALVRQQRLLLTALTALLRGAPPPPDLDRQLRELHHAYRAADDMPGAGNCTAGRAVVTAAQHDLDAAGRLLDEAAREYAWDGDNRPPLASGAALVDVLRRLFARRRA